MPHTKADYSKTVIYKIQHREIDELLYVGSTTDFTRRKKQHQKMCNNADSKFHNFKVYQMIRDNGGWDAFNMTIIKEFPCQNKYEAFMEEDRCMIEMKANMNSVRACQTHEEYLKQYRYRCICGATITNKRHIKDHEKTIKHQLFILKNEAIW